MSKNKKAPKGKSGKAGKEKKPVKKAVKPSAKSGAAKKSSAAAAKTNKASRTVPTKKVVKKSAAKTAVKTKVKSVKSAVKSNKTLSVKNQAKPASKQKVSPKPLNKKASTPLPSKKAPAKVVASKKIDKTPKTVAKKAEPVQEIKTKAPVKPLTETKPVKVEENPKKQASDKKNQDVLAITNTIPVSEKPVISASRIASISQTITNPIKRPDSYSVRVEKEPAGKFEMEFVVHASADMLYEFLSTPSGLSEWFCDDLNIRNGIYTFIWEDTMQQARLLKTVELHLVRFQWVDKTDGSYFEFRIQRDDLTNDISLIITDFAESNSERESAKLLWHSQIEKLMHVIGSIF